MKLKERIHRFLHDEKLKRKLYVIIFESDTPCREIVRRDSYRLYSGQRIARHHRKPERTSHLSDDSVRHYGIPFHRLLYFRIPDEDLLFTRPRKYIFSFFGIVDLLATLPLYIGLLFPGARYLLIIRAFRLILCSASSSFSTF